MPDFLTNLEVDFISFAIGFAAGGMVMWLVMRFWPQISGLWGRIRERTSRVSRPFRGSLETRFRKDAYKIYSRNHLADPLFRMSEIAIAPKLIAPPPPVIPGEALPPEAITDVAVPFLPDMPEIGAQFHIKTLTIPETMSRGGNLLLFGPPGSGRTFALSYLGAQVAVKAPETGALADLVPIYVHAGALDQGKLDKPVDAIYNTLANEVSLMVEASLLDFFRQVFEKRRALLLVDGLDELLPDERKKIVEMVAGLQSQYPGNRYVVVSSPEDLSAMTSLRLFPFAVAGFTPTDKKEFIRTWSKQWLEQIPGQSWARSLPDIFDPVILNAWVYNAGTFSSPLDLTLKVWAAYAGDSRGPSEADAIDAYLRRMSVGITNARPALENLAAQSVLNTTPFLQRRTAASYIARFEEVEGEEAEDDADFLDEVDSLLEEVSALPVEAEGEEVSLDDDLDALLDELDEIDLDGEDTGEEEAPEREGGRPRGRALLPQLTEAGLLVEHPNGRFSIAHQVFAGFLAAAGLTTPESLRSLNEQQIWSGKFQAQRFLPHYQVDVTPLLAKAAQEVKANPLQSELIEASAWLRHVSGNPAWRTNFMRSLAGILQNDNHPLGLRARVLSNLVLSGIGGVGKLMTQMLQSPIHSVRWLGALGMGLIRDPGALEDLSYLLYESSAFVSQAACLALATYGTQRSLEILTEALLHANDQTRRAAAEALALHPEEGHPVLKDGAKVEDVNVRRAVVFGLARVNEDWARGMLLEMQTGDDQWVVRNAALQINEDMKLEAISIPAPLPRLHETEWLIRYAGEQGMGLSPGQAAWDMLATALREGNDETQMAAMYIYRVKPEEARPVLETLTRTLADREDEIREAAYYTLWHLRANHIY